MQHCALLKSTRKPGVVDGFEVLVAASLGVGFCRYMKLVRKIDHLKWVV